MLEAEPVTLELSDGYRAFARWWKSGTGNRTVVYLHGIQSHGAWFVDSASHLAAHGLSVLMPDRRGSGRNAADRGHASSARRLVEDTLEAVGWARHATAAGRVHLVGVSWGAKLALAAQQAEPRSVRSLALISPGLFAKVDLTLPTKVVIGLSGLLRPRRYFDIPLNEPELFTANPARIRFIADDPLRLRCATASLMIASRRLDWIARHPRRRSAAPLHLFLAENDDIIRTDHTKAWARNLPWTIRRITQYEGAHHTLEFEPNPQPFFNDLHAALAD